MATYSNPVKLFKPVVSTEYNAAPSIWLYRALCTPMDEYRRPHSDPMSKINNSVHEWTTTW